MDLVAAVAGHEVVLAAVAAHHHGRDVARDRARFCRPDGEPRRRLAADELVGAAAEDGDVVAAARGAGLVGPEAEPVVVAEQRVVARAGDQRVVARAADQPVLVLADVAEQVVAGSALDLVGLLVAGDRVLVPVALEHVDAVAAVDEVVARAAGDRVRPGAADVGVVAGAERETVAMSGRRSSETSSSPPAVLTITGSSNCLPGGGFRGDRAQAHGPVVAVGRRVLDGDDRAGVELLDRPAVGRDDVLRRVAGGVVAREDLDRVLLAAGSPRSEPGRIFRMPFTTSATSTTGAEPGGGQRSALERKVWLAIVWLIVGTNGTSSNSEPSSSSLKSAAASGALSSAQPRSSPSL